METIVDLVTGGVLPTWALTYVLHSTVLVGTSLLVSRAFGSKRLPLQECLLRTALLAGLVTSTLQVAVGAPLPSSVLHLSLDSPAGTSPAVLSVPESGTRSLMDPIAAVQPGLSDTRHVSPTLGVIATGLTLGWLLGAGVGVSRLVRSKRRLRELMRGRRFLPDGRWVRAVTAALGIRRRVRLSACPKIRFPFATGVTRPEVCMPERALNELSVAQREGLLAHELAHIARRDPIWLLVGRLVENVFFLQPLNRVARRRLQVLAECLSDDRAVCCTGTRVDPASAPEVPWVGLAGAAVAETDLPAVPSVPAAPAEPSQPAGSPAPPVTAAPPDLDQLEADLPVPSVPAPAPPPRFDRAMLAAPDPSILIQVDRVELAKALAQKRARQVELEHLVREERARAEAEFRAQLRLTREQLAKQVEQRELKREQLRLEVEERMVSEGISREHAEKAVQSALTRERAELERLRQRVRDEVRAEREEHIEQLRISREQFELDKEEMIEVREQARRHMAEERMRAIEEARIRAAEEAARRAEREDEEEHEEHAERP